MLHICPVIQGVSVCFSLAVWLAGFLGCGCSRFFWGIKSRVWSGSYLKSGHFGSSNMVWAFLFLFRLYRCTLKYFIWRHLKTERLCLEWKQDPFCLFLGNKMQGSEGVNLLAVAAHDSICKAHQHPRSWKGHPLSGWISMYSCYLASFQTALFFELMTGV